MKKFVIISTLLISSTVYASNPHVERWITAMKNNGDGLTGATTQDFKYTRLSFDFKNRLIKGAKNNQSFFAKESNPSTIEVDEARTVADGQLFILTTTSEYGMLKEWETHLLVRPNGIAGATEIAKEGRLRGYPPGCPETMYKRDFIVSLRGTPDGFNSPKTIKLYTYRMGTDPLDYAHRSLNENELKQCKPTPDRENIFSEVVVFDSNEQIEQANTVAIQNKEKGGKFFKEDGTNFPGRLFSVNGDKEGLLLTFTAKEESETKHVAKLYLYRGNGWKQVWGFDVGHNAKTQFSGRSSGDIEWSLKSSKGDSGAPEITARLETNNSKDYACPEGTIITYVKSGSGFKLIKSDQPEACFKHSADSSLMASPDSDERPKKIVTGEEVDWRFE